MAKIEGSCLCGSVRYASSAGPVMTAVCQCDVLQPVNPEPLPEYFLGKRIHSVLSFPLAYEVAAHRNAKGYIEIG